MHRVGGVPLFVRGGRLHFSVYGAQTRGGQQAPGGVTQGIRRQPVSQWAGGAASTNDVAAAEA